MATLEFDDFGLYRRGHFRSRAVLACRLRLQPRLTLAAVQPHPLGQGAAAHPHFAGHLLHGETFLQAQLYGFTANLKRVGVNVWTFCPSRRPPRGAGPLPLLLNLAYTFHR